MIRTCCRPTCRVSAGEIVRVHDPVFPPDGDAADALAWLRATDH